MATELPILKFPLLQYQMCPIPKILLDSKDQKQERKEGVLALAILVETGY